MMRKYTGDKKGIFLAFEGPEGCGKSTQINLFTEFLKENDLTFQVTREPGGTPIGEAVRNILLDPANKAMFPMTEAYLYAASRAQHVREKLLPLLNEGKIVISDRFVDSSIIYQGVGRGLGMERVLNVNLEAVWDLFPALSFVIMVKPDVGLQRAKDISGSQGYSGGDRLEQEKREFHTKIYEGFKKLPDFRKNVVIIDGERDIDSIQTDIRRIFLEKFDV